MADLTLHSNTESFIGDIKRLVEQGRNAAYGAVNAVMIETYWRIGQRIVEQEQKGKERAKYGTQLIEMLSAELTKSYGKGFSVRNLWLFKPFYLTFNDLEILHTRLQNLIWSLLDSARQRQSFCRQIHAADAHRRRAAPRDRATKGIV